MQFPSYPMKHSLLIRWLSKTLHSPAAPLPPVCQILHPIIAPPAKSWPTAGLMGDDKSETSVWPPPSPDSPLWTGLLPSSRSSLMLLLLIQAEIKLLIMVLNDHNDTLAKTDQYAAPFTNYFNNFFSTPPSIKL